MSVSVGLYSGSGNKGNTSILEMTHPISIFGPGRGEYREGGLHGTDSALPLKSNPRLDSHGIVLK